MRPLDGIIRKPSKSIETKVLETPVVSDRDFNVDVDYETGREHTSEILPDSLFTDEYFMGPEEDAIPLKNRLLTDDGRFTAKVIVSPVNKKAIQGYAHIAYVWGERYDPPDSLRHPVQYLTEALNSYTNIATHPVVEKVSGNRLPFYPLMYLSTSTLLKLENPGRYLRSAGFYVIDNNAVDYNQCMKHRRKLLILLSRMYNPYLKISPLPRSHPVYHCFFDFDNGPPPGAIADASGTIEGIYIGRHLAGVYCSQGFGALWNDEVNEDQLKLGVNLAVFALAPGKWYDNNLRLSFSDTAENEYTEWYEKGGLRFKAHQFGVTDVKKTQFDLNETAALWLPQFGVSKKRIVSYTINYNRGGGKFNPDSVKTSYFFDYDGHFEFLVKNVSQFDSDPFHGRVQIHWGLYNLYEGWYANGQKMYYYIYNDRMFVEWDENGRVTARENNQGNDKIAPVATNKQF